jgi:predicted short-subunit dehydrogenase-like oxidoreductase (DUF2520 family)
MQKVVIIGAGNVAHHLGVAIKNAGLDILQVYSRTIESARSLGAKLKVDFISDSSQISEKADLYLVAVKDAHIKTIVAKLNMVGGVIAHTSGSISMNELSNSGKNSIGVFYPLQTFTISRTPNISEVPFFIEATSTTFSNQLIQLASVISDNVSLATSEERKKMHVAAVMVNNFTNHILLHAKKYSDENDIDFNHFLPLLSETVNKLASNTPFDAQTGPARRGDSKTVSDHINLLEGKTKEIYTLLSESIKQTYSKNDEL